MYKINFYLKIYVINSFNSITWHLVSQIHIFVQLPFVSKSIQITFSRAGLNLGIFHRF